VRYRGRRAGGAAVRLCIPERVTQRRRFGYGRLHLLLTREGHHMNHKRFRRLYREEKLQVRRRGGRKRALGMRGNKKSDEFVRLVWWGRKRRCNKNTSEVKELSSNSAIVSVGHWAPLGRAPKQWSTTMMRIAALALAATLIALPAVAQSQGKSKTAPGHSTTNPAPGQTNDPKKNAPGQMQKNTDDPTKKFAPGQGQKTAPK
jgi:hypothetical protein